MTLDKIGQHQEGKIRNSNLINVASSGKTKQLSNDITNKENISYKNKPPLKNNYMSLKNLQNNDENSKISNSCIVNPLTKSDLLKPDFFVKEMSKVFGLNKQQINNINKAE